jgi:ribonuclease Z
MDEKFPAAGIRVVSHDITEGVVYSEHGVKVTAFLVDHGPVQPAFGYRVDFGGRSVALSGDTRVSENLIRFVQGVDVLIHEGIDPDAMRNRANPPSPAALDAIIAHHTTAEQAGEVFSRVKPRLAVFSHAPNSDRMISLARRTYAGPLVGAEDLLTIVIGEKIEVRHVAR